MCLQTFSSLNATWLSQCLSTTLSAFNFQKRRFQRKAPKVWGSRAKTNSSKFRFICGSTKQNLAWFAEQTQKQNSTGQTFRVAQGYWTLPAANSVFNPKIFTATKELFRLPLVTHRFSKDNFSSETRISFSCKISLKKHLVFNRNVSPAIRASDLFSECEHVAMKSLQIRVRP